MRVSTVRVPITRLAHGEGLPIPHRATPGAAAYDLSAAVQDEVVLEPGARTLVPTGFAVAIPPGYEGQVRPRSGLALRHGILLPNAPGTIDSDYRGEIQVVVLNAGTEPFTVRRGDRVAQLVIAPVVEAAWEEVPELEGSERGSGGFGHTGQGPRAPDGALPEGSRP